VLTLINIERSILETGALTESILGQPRSFFGRRKVTQSLTNLRIAISGDQREQCLNASARLLLNLFSICVAGISGFRCPLARSGRLTRRKISERAAEMETASYA
jgi:hypothetical protein